jgi:hypothetical protein
MAISTNTNYYSKTSCYWGWNRGWIVYTLEDSRRCCNNTSLRRLWGIVAILVVCKRKFRKRNMSCVLSIAGKKLDIDDFIIKSGLKGFVKNYKDENETSKSKQGKHYSFVSATNSDADLSNFEKQISDVIVYLKRNRKKLAFISSTKEIEYATINFMIGLKSVSSKYFAKYIYLPKELTILCGSLNIGIEVAIVR